MKSNLGTRIFCPLCRLITKTENEKENHTLCARKIICPSSIREYDVSYF